MASTFAPEDVAAFEHATWSRCAPGYEEGFAVLTSEAVPRLLEAARTTRGTRLLDVGTGTGGVAVAAEQIGAEVAAVDFSEAMLAAARRQHPDIDFRLAPADDLPFRQGSFDALVANAVLHHLGDPARALGEAHRVLSPGGRIACTIWAEPVQLEAFGIFFAAVEQHAGAAELPHGPLFGVTDRDTLEGLFTAAGFVGFDLEPVDVVWRMDSVERLIQAFTPWAQLDSFPEAVRIAIENDVRQAAESYRDGTGVAIPNPMLVVTATRSG